MRSTLRAVPATVPDPFSDRLLVMIRHFTCSLESASQWNRSSVHQLKSKKKRVNNFAAPSPRSWPAPPTISATRQATAQVPRLLSAGRPRRPQGPLEAEGPARPTCSWSAARFPAAGSRAEQYLGHRRPGRQVRQRHPAHHHPAGHSAARRAQGQPQGDHRRHQRHAC